MPYLKLDGLDIIELVEDIKWSINDLDGPDSGRTLDTMMQRDKLGEKIRADIKLNPCESKVAIPILRVLRNQYFMCETDLIPDAEDYPIEMYNSARSGNIQIVNTDKKVIHKDISFNIIER